MHSRVGKRQNTSKTCIFTLWRVGKRAFSPSGEWDNVHVCPTRRGCTPVPRTCKIRQKRAFLPSGEWGNVHFCAFYSGKTVKYVKNVHFHPLESGKTCISAHSTVGKRQNTSKTCIFTLC